MNVNQPSAIFVIFIALWLHFGCEARIYGDGGVAAKLELAGAEFETDDAGNIVGVNFCDELATADDLSLLAKLEHIASVSISGVGLGDDGLKHLSSLTTLKGLNASETKCTDRDIENLVGLTAIEWINLSDTAITDASIDTLVKLPNLKSVTAMLSTSTSTKKAEPQNQAVHLLTACERLALNDSYSGRSPVLVLLLEFGHR